MTYDEFRDKVRNAMHETIYTDSDGREILVIKVLEAYSLLTPKRPWIGLTDEQREACTQSPFTEDNYQDIEDKLRELNA